MSSGYETFCQQTVLSEMVKAKVLSKDAVQCVELNVCVVKYAKQLKYSISTQY